MNKHPDVIIEVRFKTTEEGGRKGPVYIEQFRCPVSVDNELFDGCMPLNGQRIELGQTYRLQVWFLWPDLVLPKLSVGKDIALWDGKEIAVGKVIELPDTTATDSTMTEPEEKKFVEAELQWLIPNPTTQPTAGLNGYRKEVGFDDLFSIYAYFSDRDGVTSPWRTAKIFSLVAEMEGRLPAVGDILVLTAGPTPVAEARITRVGSEDV